jgi:hypothetical protein
MRYSSYSFSTLALDGAEWSASRPCRALPPGKGPPVPIVQEAGWAPEPVWTVRLEGKSFRLCRESNLDRPVVQPVARHYTELPGSQMLMLQTLISRFSLNSLFTLYFGHLPNLLLCKCSLWAVRAWYNARKSLRKALKLGMARNVRKVWGCNSYQALSGKVENTHYAFICGMKRRIRISFCSWILNFIF